MQKKRFLFIVLALIPCILLFGCQAKPPDPFGFLSSNFSAELNGTMGNVSFCVLITVENCDGGRFCRLVYSSPKALDGVEIELLCGTDGVGVGSAAVKSPDGIEYTVNAASVKGLCLPLYSLLAVSETNSVQKTDAGYLFTTSDGAERSLSSSGIPLSLSSSSITWNVRWFQSV